MTNYEARVLLKWCRTRIGYLLGISTPWVFLHEYPRSTKKKKLNTSSNKYEIASIFSLVLPSIKPLEYLSFILFYFGFNVEHFFYLVFWILVCTLTTI